MLERIGRYRVHRRIGSGAFATVWLAVDDTLESLVAIKVLAENWSHQADIRARFTQEAQIMRRADSDRLVRVLDVGELPDGRPYLVMPYAAGGTLADRLTRPMPIELAVHTAADVARAVAVLHDAGAIHRDLTPSNVLFTGPPEERVLIADLGLAKAIAHASGFTVIAGSPAYMAPEQAIPGGGLTVHADVYAVGALLYHMLTGRPPDRAAVATPVLRPSRLRPGISRRVDELVLRALAFAPDKRWRSAVALADALDRALDGAGTPQGDAEPRPARGRGRLVVRTIMAVVLTMLAVVALTASAAAHSTSESWRRLSDASGAISVAVPAAWAKQAKDSGWNPATIGLPPGRAPGLLVGPNLAAWPYPTTEVPGVFVGRSDALLPGGPAPNLPDHSGCVHEPDRTRALGAFTAQIAHWSGCAGGPTAFDEVLLRSPNRAFGVYVQIKQIDGTDRTDAILDRLRVS